MAKNTSRKRSKPFVPLSERKAPRPDDGSMHWLLDQERSTPKASPVNRVLSRMSGSEVTGGAKLVESHKPAPSVSRRAAVSSARRRGILIGAGATAAVGGGAYLIHRSRRSKPVSKSLINPFEEAVVFGKAYPVAVPPQRSVVLRALVPTGRHAEPGVERYTGKKSGGRKAGVEHYTTKPRGLRQGPFGKALTPPKPSVANGLRLAAGKGPKPSVANGLQMVHNTNPDMRSTVARVRAPKVNSKIPDTGRAGRRLP